MNLKIFCCAINYHRIIDKLPNYIIPLGLGKSNYPKTWLTEKEGNNIFEKNKYFGEATGIYWVWKNYLKNFETNDWIGFCQYRRLWLNDIFEEKQKNNFSSLYSNLLKTENKIFKNVDTVLLQKTFLKNESLLDQFDKIYGKNILNHCVELLPAKDKEDFLKYLNGNELSICNMFITKTEIFERYCKEMFDWINKCYIFCNDQNLLVGKNTRLPIFMVERFTSFWFEKYTKCNYLSFARLGDAFLSNRLNYFVNTIKLPFTFRQFPTIHKF